jgi:dipeptidyl aminopeptidase/acylaminoacyl peptidase
MVAFNLNLRMLASIFLLISLILESAPVYPANGVQDTLFWNQWLIPGIIKVHPPAFSAQKNLKGKTFKHSDFLGLAGEAIKSSWPSAGQAFQGPMGQEMVWQKHMTDRNGILKVESPSRKHSPYLAYAASYIRVKSYQEVKLVLNSRGDISISLDDEEIANASPDKDGKTKVEKLLKLDPGKHRLMITAVLPASDSGRWSFQPLLVLDTLPDRSQLMTSADNIRPMDISLTLDGPRIQSVDPSWNGQYLLMRYSDTRPPDGKTESWYEIIDRETGRVVLPLRGSNISRASWAPNEQMLAFSRKESKQDALVTLDLRSGETSTVGYLSNLVSFRWSPDGTFFICSITEKEEPEKDGVRRYEHMPDRWPWWRNRNFLVRIDIRTGFITRLTWGHLSTRLQDVRPDGKAILVSMSEPDLSARPFNRTWLVEIGLDSLNVDTLLISPYDCNAAYSPDGQTLMMTGSPALFGRVGTATEDSLIPNDYDTQLYLYNRRSKEARCPSLNFDPSIEGAKWNHQRNIIYLLAEEGTYRRLYSLQPGSDAFRQIGQEPDVVSDWSVSGNGDWIGYTGSSISRPDMGYIKSTSKEESRVVADPEKDIFENVQLGKTAEWNHKYNGTTIEGRLYYPPDFDPERKYPLIVYYYGGTNPTPRDFRGRYPKHLYAAAGYVVYVLQPSGATGYGQEFSARHVNNWGITVADEIIGCTRAFLNQHPFIDSTRVGCIGASYGGFMTMLLTTRTSLFSAAVSHAGISSISSYWGEGYWGYAYSSVASAGSFPWNRPDIYIGQSPLFHADKINTPLLLLHGGSDTNVPPGESIQMFTALKLLGKTVEYIEIEGQDHHILDYRKRIKWQKTILAWFDRYLKGEEGWWKDLYPEKDI